MNDSSDAPLARLDFPGAERDQKTAPAWVGSIMAQHADLGVVFHAVVLVAGQSAREAYDQATNLALRQWPLREGWEGHDAVVAPLEQSLREWYVEVTA